MAEFAIIFDGVRGDFLAKQVGTVHLANAAITSAKIGSGQVGGPLLAAAGVLSAHVGGGVLATPHIQNQGILSASLAALAVGAPHIANEAVISGKLGSGLPLSRFLMDIQSFTNLLTNGDFEIGNPPTGWASVTATLTQETTPTPKIGSYILKVVNTNWNGRALQSISDYARYKNRKVTLGAWVYFPSTNIDNVQFSIYDGVMQTWSAVIPKDDAWHWMTVTRTVDALATELTVQFLADDGEVQTNEILYVDGAILVEGDTCPAFSPKPIDIQSVISGSIAPNILATPHIANQGILSASIASGIIGGPLLQDWGILSGKVASGAIQPDNISFLGGMMSRPTPYGCVLDLDFAEGFGTKAYDKSGLNNDGSLLPDPGGPTWATDPLMGSCLSFDGVDDYVDAGNAASLTPTTAITLEAWVNPTSLATTYKAIIAKSRDDISRYAYDIVIRQSGTTYDKQLQFVVFKTNANYHQSISTTEIPLNTWTHIVTTWKGSTNTVKIYINGVLDTLVYDDPGITVDSIQSTVDPVRVGAYVDNTKFFNGLIAPPRIYNRALGTDEIRGRYIQGPSKLGKIQGSFRQFNSGWVPKIWLDPETADFQAVSGGIRTSGLIYAGTSQVQLTNAAGYVISGGVAAGALATPHILNQGILSASIGANVLATPHMQNQGILSASIGTNILATPHIQNQGILSASIGTNILATPHFANQGILSASIGANVLATAHILAGGILSASIASGSVGPHIAAGAVLSAHMAGGVLATPHIQNQGVLSASIGASVLATPHIANQGILSASIGSGQLGPHIAAGAMLSAHVAGGVLATPHFANQGILSASIASGSLGPHIAAGAVLSAHVGSGALATPHILAGGILSASIGSGSLGPHIAAGAVLSAHVGSGQIGFFHTNPAYEKDLPFGVFGSWSGTPGYFIGSGGLGATDKILSTYSYLSITAGPGSGYLEWDLGANYMFSHIMARWGMTTIGGSAWSDLVYSVNRVNWTAFASSFLSAAVTGFVSGDVISSILDTARYFRANINGPSVQGFGTQLLIYELKVEG